MNNPFEFLGIDPTFDIREITEICKKLSSSATEKERHIIRDALVELRDERKRLDYALFAHHEAAAHDSDWSRFLHKYKRLPFKLKDILSKDVTQNDVQDIDWDIIELLASDSKELDEGIFPDIPEELANEIDFEEMTIDFLLNEYTK